MAQIKKKLARRAVRSTAKHTVHGTASKLKRDPIRAAALLGIGAIIGAFGAWLLGRGNGAGGDPKASLA
ncbi:MAG: hypothetical protein QOF23_1033 [Solirubrobacterales bacterium]|jgi:hypothetical protein|nr:hypothetical protein [Solirubrobacterales bacterium]